MVWQSKPVVVLPALLWIATGGECIIRFGATRVNEQKFRSRWCWSRGGGVARYLFWYYPRAVGHGVLRNDVRNQHIVDLYVLQC